MIEIRPFESLGRFENDWLSARHHFSFGHYHDPERNGFGSLLVWNDDTIAPGRGFDLHGHRDMEIITFVRQGAITHEDHLGNRGRTEAGDVQVMTAGTGIVHSEYNRETEGATTLFQIWIEPASTNLRPAWRTRAFPKDNRDGELTVLASGRAGDAGALAIHQDVALLGATLRAGETVAHRLSPGRRAYLVPALGAIRVNGIDVAELDGVAVWDESRLTIEAREASEVVLVDLP